MLKLVVLRLVPVLALFLIGINLIAIHIIGLMSNGDNILYLVSSDESASIGSIHLLDVPTRINTEILPNVYSRPASSPINMITTPDWSADGKSIQIVGTLDNQVDVSNLPLMVSPDKDVIEIAQIWAEHDPAHVLAINTSPNSRYLAYMLSTEVDGVVLVIFDREQNQLIQVDNVLQETPFLPQWSPDSTRFVYITRSEKQQRVFLYTLQNRVSEEIILTEGELLTFRSDPIENIAINHIKWNHTGSTLHYSLTNYSDKVMMVILDVESGERTYIPEGDDEQHRFAVVAPNDARVALVTNLIDENGYQGVEVRILNDNENRLIHSISGVQAHDFGLARSLVWSTSGRYLIFHTGTPEIIILNAETGEEVHRMSGQYPVARP